MTTTVTLIRPRHLVPVSVAVLAAASVIFGDMRSPAVASTRTFCTTIAFPDMRTGCDNDGNGEPDPGMLYPCHSGGRQNAGYLVFDVYDYDPPGNAHEYIGSWFAAGYGPVCVTFEWEGASYSKGEPNPDPYVKVTSWEWSTTDYRNLFLRMSDGSTPPALSWHNNYATDCTAGTQCWSPGINLIQGSTALPETLAKIGDSAIHGLNAFHTLSTDVTVRYCTASEELAGCARSMMRVASTSP